MVLPGTYRLELVADGQTFVQPLIVKPDPRVTVSANHQKEQLAFTLGVSEMFTDITKTVLKIRSIRDQIQSLLKLLAGKELEEIKGQAKTIVEKLDDIEGLLHNPKAEVAYDILGGRHGGTMLHSHVEWLFMSARGHLGPPTQGMREAADEYKALLATHKQSLQTVVETDLKTLEDLIEKQGLPRVIVSVR